MQKKYLKVYNDQMNIIKLMTENSLDRLKKMKDVRFFIVQKNNQISFSFYSYLKSAPYENIFDVLLKVSKKICIKFFKSKTQS